MSEAEKIRIENLEAALMWELNAFSQGDLGWKKRADKTAHIVAQILWKNSPQTEAVLRHC